MLLLPAELIVTVIVAEPPVVTESNPHIPIWSFAVFEAHGASSPQRLPNVSVTLVTCPFVVTEDKTTVEAAVRVKTMVCVVAEVALSAVVPVVAAMVAPAGVGSRYSKTAIISPRFIGF
jgi:hypothetical protein